MSSLLISDAPIGHQTEVDISAGDMSIADGDGRRLGEGDPDGQGQFTSVFTSDALYNKMPWTTRLDIIRNTASAFAFLHSSLDRYPIVHTDLKPSNILLGSNMEPKVSDFRLSRVLHAVPTQFRPLGAKPSGKPASKHGIDIKIGSLLTHLQRYFSVQHHRLVQMLPPARKLSCDILTSRVRLITSKSDPDSCRSGHSMMAVNTKTSASWVVATAAPHHATGNRNLLSGFIMEHDDQFVHAVNRVPMKVLARGAVVTDALILPDVWFVPGLTENLVSVSQLAEHDYSIGFRRGECCIRSARDANIVGKGCLQIGGHYELDYLKIPLAI